MALVVARCSWAPPWPHFHFQQFHAQNRPTLRTQAIATNKAGVVKTKIKKKKKKKDKVGQSPREEVADDEEGDHTDIVDMDEWMKNKPPGFGIGKEYDTSLEEQILVELEQGSAASAGKNSSRKRSPSDPETSNQMGRISLKDGKVVEGRGQKSINSKKPVKQVDGFKVKITHLPRKKNISRDLRLAFKGFSGLLQIRPNELANKKTREPVCKGSAMLTFAKEDQALRFIEKFRDLKLAFGNLQKLPTYELHIPKIEKKKQTAEDLKTNNDDDDEEEGEEVVSTSRILSTDEDRSDTVQVLARDEDEVQELVADTIIEEDEDDNEEDDEDRDGGGDDEESEEEDESFDASSAALSGEFEDSDEEDDGFEDDGLWIEDDNGEDDDGGDQSGAVELPGASSGGGGGGGGKTHFVEVDVSVPFTTKDVAGDPEAVIVSSNARILELDKEIGKLQKSIKRKKNRPPEVEQQILKLREEKIELLEKRVLARIVAAREAHRARREKKLAAAAAAAAEEEESSSRKSGRRMDDEKWREVVAKHFS